MMKRLIGLFLITAGIVVAQDKLLFLHVPKVGGITFGSLLMDHYRDEESIVLIDWANLSLEMDKLKTGKINLVTGHCLYFQAKDLFHDFKKMTILRDPVERVLSEHRYIYERGHDKLNEFRSAHFLPLDQDPIQSASNVICKFLSSLDPFDPLIPIEKHLQSAKETLANDFDLVGLTEEMDLTVAMCNKLMGWNQVEEVPFHNTTQKKDYPLQLKQEIAARNWADIQLYEFAKELFEKQKMTIFQIASDHHETLNWTDTVDFTFDSPLSGSGWCPREKVNGFTFRWLWSSEKGKIYFPLMAGSDYEFNIEAVVPLQLIKKVQILVNGFPLKLKVSRLPGEPRVGPWFAFKGNIPRSYLIPNQKTQIEIQILDKKRPVRKDAYCGRLGARKIVIHPVNQK